MIYTLDLEGDVQAAFTPIRRVEVDDSDLFLKGLRGRWEGVALQAIDARYVAGPGHLRAVLKQAWEASRRMISRAKKLDIDIVMRVACDSRASNALKTVGLKKGLNDVVFVLIGRRGALHQFSESEGELGEPSDEILRLTGEKEAFLKKHHGIDDVTLEATLLKREDRLAAVLAEKAAVELSGR